MVPMVSTVLSTGWCLAVSLFLSQRWQICDKGANIHKQASVDRLRASGGGVQDAQTKVAGHLALESTPFVNTSEIGLIQH